MRLRLSEVISLNRLNYITVRLRLSFFSGVTRVELATFGVTNQYSNQMSYTPIIVR